MVDVAVLSSTGTSSSFTPELQPATRATIVRAKVMRLIIQKSPENLITEIV
jgi:hypothetical protein